MTKINHTGTPCPVDDDAIVRVYMRNGETIEDRADMFHWHFDPPNDPNSGGDIIAYELLDSATSEAEDVRALIVALAHQIRSANQKNGTDAFIVDAIDRLERVALSTRQSSAVRDGALEEAAKLLDAWLSPQTMRLHCGELSAQEVRTVTAVLKSRAHTIRSLKGSEAHGETREYGVDKFYPCEDCGRKSTERFCPACGIKSMPSTPPPISPDRETVTEEMVEAGYGELRVEEEPPSEGCGYRVSRESFVAALESALRARKGGQT